jgi:hypothetical protein
MNRCTGTNSERTVLSVGADKIARDSSEDTTKVLARK